MTKRVRVFSFIAAPTATALSPREPASAETSHDSCGGRDSGKETLCCEVRRAVHKVNVDQCSNVCTNFRDSVHVRDTCSAEVTNRRNSALEVCRT